MEPNHENLVNENEMLELLIGLTSGGSIENQGDGRSIRVETSDNMGRRSNKFQLMFNEISEELYSWCTKISALLFLVKTMHIKVMNHWNNKSFDMLLELRKESLPNSTKIPKSYYDAKKRLHD